MAKEWSELKHNPSFFKVLIDENSARLKLPPVFVRNYIQWNLAETISLKLDSGMSWNAKMERDETGCYFARGWAKFAKDLGLEALDFLTFRLICEKQFKVTVYGVNCCEKDILVHAPSGTKHTDTVSKGKVKIPAEKVFKKGNSSGKSADLSFQKCLSKHDRRVLLVPKAIERELQLGTIKTSIIIKDLKGKRHRVRAKVRESTRNKQVYLTTGWSTIVCSNRLKIRDTVKLEFPGNEGGTLANLQVRRARQDYWNSFSSKRMADRDRLKKIYN